MPGTTVSKVVESFEQFCGHARLQKIPCNAAVQQIDSSQLLGPKDAKKLQKHHATSASGDVQPHSCAQPAPAAWFSGSMVWRAQNSHNLVSGGGNRTNCSCCPDGVWFSQRGPSRCLSGRQGRLFWEGHSGAYKSNPTHVHCLPPLTWLG